MEKALSSKDGEKILSLSFDATMNMLRPIIAQQSAMKKILQLLLADASPDLLNALLTILENESKASKNTSSEMQAAWHTVAKEWQDTVTRIKKASHQ